ncbi:MAG TPA: undecaprenyl-phosphate 4-deoxy-4-formamido-L-arabinose transferase, partial [Lentisphaeria bacterium]|nr:undecaprenyl-phosphate 4-deoxy-4-formamido-L-arabinose transferase [Lentisphaeria bacterium]
MELTDKPELSLVIPVYNEEANLSELIRRTLAACDPMGISYEMILVDDGSADNSAQMIREAAEKNGGKVVGVFLTTNFGQHAAVTAGLQTSVGKYVITLDADLQNPPEEIPKLVEKLREGYDVVGTIRENRKDTFFRRWASKTVNLMVRKLCNGKTMTDYGCMLRGYSRTVVNAILQCPEHGKFIPMLAMSYARRTVEIHVKHADRMAGESKYNFWKLIALQYDLLTGTSTFPLRMLTYIGTLLAAFGILFGLYIFIMTRIHGDNWSQNGVFTLFSLVFIFMGGQFVAMGILGEYIGKIHMNTRGR